MPRRDRPTSLASHNSNANDRPEPRLLRAVETNQIDAVRAIIEEAEATAQGGAALLSVALVRACDKNNLDVARFLLQHRDGADPNFVSGNKLPSIIRAAENGHAAIVELLIAHNVDLLACDNKHQRTALMTAAWKDNIDIVTTLLATGVGIHATDRRRRNALHNIAAVNSAQQCSSEVVQALIAAGMKTEARDETGRTPLHWACAAGNVRIANCLLAARVNLEALDSRMKTPLHLAIWHDRLELAHVLLDRGANIHAKSDGGWTAIHYASSRASPPLVDLLVEAGADVNGELLNGRTPLHAAAEFGNVETTDCLLRRSHVKRAVKDRFGNTPLMIAAQHGKKDILEMLAPWNHLDLLSPDEKEACRRFEATIVDFGDFRNENKVSKRSVFDLLYTRDAVSTMPKQIKATRLRWIHLPANNVAWCDALLTKRFLEEGAIDVEGYKAMEASFGQQHRGQKQHSRFMRPMCSAVLRQADVDDCIGGNSNKSGGAKRSSTKQMSASRQSTFSSDISNQENADVRPLRVPKSSLSSAVSMEQGQTAEPVQKISDAASTFTNIPKIEGKRGQKMKEPASLQALSKKGDAGKHESAAKKSAKEVGFKKDARQKASRNNTMDSSVSSIRSKHASTSNVYLFMPYLHFESDERRREMQEAIEYKRYPDHQMSLHEDEVLIRAHLTASSSFLHLRRTLDQFFYHNIDTQTRDADQVVYRYQKRHEDELSGDPKIFMVDQLWMWIIGKDLVVTSFPRRWKQPRNDPLNVLDGIIEDINSKTRKPIENVYELAMTITGRCYGDFDRKGGEELQFFDMFEASLGAAMDHEAFLFQQFLEASYHASSWLLEHKRDERFSQPAFVDKLLDVGAETALLAEIKDIRDELNIIRMVLGYQEGLLGDFRKVVRNVYEQERSHVQLRLVEKIFDDQEKTISNPLKDISRMSEQAERIYISITDLLDLKQKHANAFEARFARDQAAGTIRQGRTILVFTIVTVIFLPLTFIAGVFAINLQDWPAPLTLPYVSEYIFGIGLGISIPCIVIAMTVDEIFSFFSKIRMMIWGLWPQRNNHDGGAQQQLLIMEESLSMAKSIRQSTEVRGMHVVETKGLDRNMSPWQEVRNRNRLGRRNWDVERGRR